MATALLPWSDKSGEDQASGRKESRDVAPGRPKSRKGAKQLANAPKKQPQRGMGVAQLERLREQELRRKTLVESGLPHGQLGYAFPNGNNTRGASAGVAAFMIPRLARPAYSGGLAEFPPYGVGMQRYRLVDGSRIPALADVSDRVFTGERFQKAFPLGTPEKAKELSSNQNETCSTDQCNPCNMNTRAHRQNYRFAVGGRQQGGTWTDGCDLLRLGLWSPGAADLKRAGLEPTMVKGGGRHRDFAMLTDEGIMERKGKGVKEGAILKEYEFFPAKEIISEDTEMAMGEPFVCAFPSCQASLDLSLSLSTYSCS